MKDSEEHRLYNRNFIDALKNAKNGIFYGIRTQRNIRIQIVIGIIMFVLGIIVKLSNIEYICLCFTIFLILVAEMLNTALENVVDLYTTEYNIKAKIAKDIGAGTVLLASINAIVIGYFLFFNKVINLILNFKF